MWADEKIASSLIDWVLLAFWKNQYQYVCTICLLAFTLRTRFLVRTKYTLIFITGRLVVALYEEFSSLRHVSAARLFFVRRRCNRRGWKRLRFGHNTLHASPTAEHKNSTSSDCKQTKQFTND